MTAREYMQARLKLLAEGNALTGTPEEYLKRHDEANAAQAAKRESSKVQSNNLDLIG